MFVNNLDPVAFEFLSFQIRWYSLAYIFGFLIGWLYIKNFLTKDLREKTLIDDFITYLILGVIIGGRLGYVIFYNFFYYLSHPFEIFYIWQGGMSFHGGLLGVCLATYIFTQKYNSFGTQARIKKSSNLSKKYQIDSVPTIIVNGKYLTSGSYVSSYDELYSVVNLLVERERND